MSNVINSDSEIQFSPLIDPEQVLADTWRKSTRAIKAEQAQGYIGDVPEAGSLLSAVEMLSDKVLKHNERLENKIIKITEQLESIDTRMSLVERSRTNRTLNVARPDPIAEESHNGATWRYHHDDNDELLNTLDEIEAG